MKCIVLCADDYGQAPAISEGICQLIQQNRLSAVSCLVNTAFWQEHAQWLKPFKDKIDIGLHLNFTEGRALSAPYIKAYGESLQTLSQLIPNVFLRQLDPKILKVEIHAQIEAFINALGFLPCFIDGHQHVHQFPLIRESLIEVYADYFKDQTSYMRWVNEKIKMADFLFNHKKIIINLLGARTLKKLLIQYNIPHNQSFAGIYSFRGRQSFPQLFPQFLREISNKGIIMCHPGLPDHHPTDKIEPNRGEEYQYLIGDQFIRDCQLNQVSLGRF